MRVDALDAPGGFNQTCEHHVNSINTSSPSVVTRGSSTSQSFARRGRNASPQASRRGDPLHAIDQAADRRTPAAALDRPRPAARRHRAPPAVRAPPRARVAERLNRDAAIRRALRCRPTRARRRPGRHDHYDRARREGREHPRILAGILRPPVEEDARQRPLSVDAPRREQRVVRQDRSRPDGDRVDLGALPVKVPVGRRPGQLDRARRRRPTNPSAEIADFSDHERPARA